MSGPPVCLYIDIEGINSVKGMVFLAKERKTHTPGKQVSISVQSCEKYPTARIVTTSQSATTYLFRWLFGSASCCLSVRHIICYSEKLTKGHVVQLSLAMKQRTISLHFVSSWAVKWTKFPWWSLMLNLKSMGKTGSRIVVWGGRLLVVVKAWDMWV